MRLVTGTQMAALDRHTIEQLGTPGLVLMERAGTGVVDQIRRHIPRLGTRRILIFCGKGNNGGDGYVVARRLWERWIPSTVVLTAAPEALGGDAATNWGRLGCAGVDTISVLQEEDLALLPSNLGPADVIVDALLGTGFRGSVQGLYGRLIEWMNRAPCLRVAVDIPSGVDADTGQVTGPAVRADLTVTFALPKLGHVLAPGVEHTGRLTIVDIGIPRHLADEVADGPTLFTDENAAVLLPVRRTTAHKGNAGRVLLIGGSPGLSGAIALASSAAVAAGAGLVTCGVPAGLAPVLEVKTTEAMTLALPERDGAISMQAFDTVQPWFGRVDALGLGPGLGRREETMAFVRNVLEHAASPVVLDADGLWACAGQAKWLVQRTAPLVLTPHPGELATLVGTTIGAIEQDRIGIARATAQETGAVVVLKGAFTVVAAADGRVSLNSTGNPGMASGGMGDVLTGVIAALLGQGLSAYDAARLGVFLHGRAADLVAGPLGWQPLYASQVIAHLGRAWRSVQAWRRPNRQAVLASPRGRWDDLGGSPSIPQRRRPQWKS